MSVKTFTKFDQFIIDLGNKVHNLGSDTLKVMLTNTAPILQNAVKTDITEISAGNGYSAGGNTVSLAPASPGAGYGISLVDTVFTASGGSFGPFRYAVLYNDTPTNPADPLIAWYDFGKNITVNDAEAFTVDFQSFSAGVKHITSIIPSGDPTTGFTIVIPARTQANDILLLAITNRDSTSDPSTPTDDEAAGNVWVKIVSKANATANGSVWWKRAKAASPGSTITVGGATGSCAGVLSIYRGATRKATPYQNATGEANISANENHATFTPTVNDSLVCLYVFNTDDITITANPTALNPKILTKRNEKLSTGGSHCACFHASGVQIGEPTTTGTLTWQQTNAASISIVFNLFVFQNYVLSAEPVTIDD